MASVMFGFWGFLLIDLMALFVLSRAMVDIVDGREGGHTVHFRNFGEFLMSCVKFIYMDCKKPPIWTETGPFSSRRTWLTHLSDFQSNSQIRFASWFLLIMGTVVVGPISLTTITSVIVLFGDIEEISGYVKAKV